MTGAEGKFGPKKEAAILALLTARGIEEAAKGFITEPTILTMPDGRTVSITEHGVSGTADRNLR